MQSPENPCPRRLATRFNDSLPGRWGKEFGGRSAMREKSDNAEDAPGSHEPHANSRPSPVRTDMPCGLIDHILPAGTDGRSPLRALAAEPAAELLHGAVWPERTASDEGFAT